jgi:hypothetical protein
LPWLNRSESYFRGTRTMLAEQVWCAMKEERFRHLSPEEMADKRERRMDATCVLKKFTLDHEGGVSNGTHRG